MHWCHGDLHSKHDAILRKGESGKGDYTNTDIGQGAYINKVRIKPREYYLTNKHQKVRELNIASNNSIFSTNSCAISGHAE